VDASPGPAQSITPAASVAPFALALMEGPRRVGVAMGSGHLRFQDVVLTLTPVGAPRMPNGVECSVPPIEAGSRVSVGGGRLEVAGTRILPGPAWEPVPHSRFAVDTQPKRSLDQILFRVGSGPGLTPLGDDVLAGYLAARFLSGDPVEGAQVAEALSSTTALSATLLQVAAEGALAEPAHRLLEDGALEPLLSWGATSGSGVLVGLGLGGRDRPDGLPVSVRDVALPLDPAMTFTVSLFPLR